MPYLYILKRMTHHGNEHVDKYDDDGDVVKGKQKHANAFHYRRGVVSTRETVRLDLVLFCEGRIEER